MFDAERSSGQRPPRWHEDSPGRRTPVRTVCFLLGLLTLVLYWPVTGHDFINWDDPEYVTANAHVCGGLQWESVAWAFTTGFLNWHPLTWLSHMLDCQVFGMCAGAHHLVSVLFHIANTLLLFLVLKRMTGAFWRAALVAALFAVHPLHVESVAWIAERKDVLSTFFFLLTLGAYARYVEEIRRRQALDARTSLAGSDAMFRSPRPAIHYGLSLFLFALGLMSKPMLVTLPLVLLLLDYWPLRRLELNTQHSRLKTLLPLILEKVPFLLLSLACSVVTFFVQRANDAVAPLSGLSLSARFDNAAVSYLRYAGKLFWPGGLAVFYPHPNHWPVWQVVVAVGWLLLVSAAVFFFLRSRPYLAVGWVWFLVMVVPVIGLVQVGTHAIADRYTYVPLVGLFILLVWGAADVLPRRPWRFAVAASAAGLILAACVFVTVRQLRHWRNSGTLFEHALKVSPNNYVAHNNLGHYLAQSGQAEQAIPHYRAALKINPLYVNSYENLAYELARRGDCAEAITQYQAALRIRPNHPKVYNNLANALVELGRIEEAIPNYQAALRLDPGHLDARNNLGIALAKQGKLDAAIARFREIIDADPNHVSARRNLGRALAAQGKLAEAAAEYREVVRLRPGEARAHADLGGVLVQQGNLDEATEHLTQALQQQPHNPEAYYSLGLIAARRGDPQAAANLFQEALRLNPDYAEVQKELEAMKLAR